MCLYSRSVVTRSSKSFTLFIASDSQGFFNAQLVGWVELV
jgi:hypothetical protein